LEFLGSWLFGFEKPVLGVVFPWISLDSLVRIESYQWVTRENRRRIFLRASPSAFGAPERKAVGEAMRRSKIRHKASLTWILIFCI
jgi:hypothetical protein